MTKLKNSPIGLVVWTALVCGSFLLLLGSGYKEKYTAAERLIWVLAALVFVFIIHELAHLMRLNDARQGKCIFLATEYEGNAAEYGTRSGSASGLHAGCGSARRMYAKRVCILDGSSFRYGEHPCGINGACVNDNDLNLFLSKKMN